jgi:transcriptional regulator with XRE-family HTH domain
LPEIGKDGILIVKEIELFTDEVMRNMGKRIQTERRNKGVKAIDFADVIGIGKDQLSRIENGKVPCKTEYLFAISQVLDISLDYIMFCRWKDENDNDIISMLETMTTAQKEKLIRIIRILLED